MNFINDEIKIDLLKRNISGGIFSKRRHRRK